MIKNYLVDQAIIVSKEFDICRRDLNPIVAETIESENAFLLTKIVYATAYYGKVFPETQLLRTSLALELLGWATRIGKKAQEVDVFADHLLLATDYLYAEAIEQVIGLNEPEIIKLLAKAIADTASDRIGANIDPPHLEHLIVAAYELGKLISKNSDSTPEIRDILKSCEAVKPILKSTALSSYSVS